ncbi:MAG: sugar transferase, partial [Lentisphaeria bacterium]|nr:sugar transferase [Lentisphaeria bacterium]
MYASFFKRVLDFLMALCALIVLSPLLLILIVVGAIKMKGNPFFTQARPGKDEKIFKLIKFRTMTCEVDSEGNPLPDEVRLVPYGKFLRSTSLDELPELLNILIGDMSLIGPRLVKYLPYYTDEERIRHSVRPGLTGAAQVNGRNEITWETKFAYDIAYAKKITFLGDVKIILDTVRAVLKHDNIQLNALDDFDVYRQKQHSA